MAKKYCYLFTEGNATMRELLGGKGANLAEMTNIGLPVPQGFTITTEACTQYYEDGRTINPDIMAEINEYIGKMEEITGKKFGDKENPLLVSVRSGARASMPGMMDTILNLGLNEDVVEVIAKKSGNARWAWDCYRRFIQMYSDVVMEVGKKYFEQLIDAMKEKRGVTQDVELTADDLKELAGQFKAEYKEKIGEDMYELLTMANQTTEDVFSLLDNLLKWTKSQIGKLKVVYQDIDMVEVVEGVGEIFAMVAGLKNIRLRIESPECQAVHADIDMIKTVIRNLISNAIKFSNEGSEVLIKVEESDGMSVVSVKDSGCGIDEESQKKLLHTDTHFSTFGTNNEEGSGLGLLLCQDFVVKNGGKLWFTSVKDEGSTFYFSIPLKK